jgi:hypothetical protein
MAVPEAAVHSHNQLSADLNHIKAAQGGAQSEQLPALVQVMGAVRSPKDSTLGTERAHVLIPFLQRQACQRVANGAGRLRRERVPPSLQRRQRGVQPTPAIGVCVTHR